MEASQPESELLALAVLAQAEVERSGMMPTTSQWSAPAPSPKFYADNNVHRLGRGLRTLGYDTKLYGEGTDDVLRDLCRDEGRWLLSCDSDFLGEANAVVLESVDWQVQLQAVVRHFQLDPHSYRYSLCLNCNCSVYTVEPTNHVGQVPDWVVATDDPLWRCPECERLFWAGGHLERMNARYDSLFPERPRVL